MNKVIYINDKVLNATIVYSNIFDKIKSLVKDKDFSFTLTRTGFKDKVIEGIFQGSFQKSPSYQNIDFYYTDKNGALQVIRNINVYYEELKLHD